MSEVRQLRVVYNTSKRRKMLTMLANLAKDIAEGAPIEDLYIIAQKSHSDPGMVLLVVCDTGINIAQAIFMLESHKNDILLASKGLVR